MGPLRKGNMGRFDTTINLLALAPWGEGGPSYQNPCGAVLEEISPSEDAHLTKEVWMNLQWLRSGVAETMVKQVHLDCGLSPPSLFELAELSVQLPPCLLLPPLPLWGPLCLLPRSCQGFLQLQPRGCLWPLLLLPSACQGSPRLSGSPLALPLCSLVLPLLIVPPLVLCPICVAPLCFHLASSLSNSHSWLYRIPVYEIYVV